MVELSKTLIIVLIRGLPDKSGGIQKVVFQLSSLLRDSEYKVEFIMDSEKSDVTFYDNFEINCLKFPPVYDFIYSKKYFAFKRNIKQFYKLFENRKKQYSKIIVKADWAPDFMLLTKLKSKYNVKTIFSFHGPYHINKYKRLSQRKYPWLKVFKRQLALIDRFVFISDSLYDECINMSNDFKKRAIVIKNGIPLNNDFIYKRDYELSIVMTTRLVKNKNISLVLNALKLLKENHVNFICDIYGDGDDYERLEAFIKTKNLSKHIKLKGYEKDINEVLKHYNYFISASFFEGLPLGPIEAMNQSLIPILSDISMHREILPKGIDVFFDCYDCQSLANKIMEVHRKKDADKNEIRKVLKEHVLSNFHINLRLEKFKKLIDSL